MTDRLDKLRAALWDTFCSAKNPVLAWSGGKDSTLLLLLAKSLELEFNILTFPHLWSKTQKQFIVDTIQQHQLTVFHYAPVNINFVAPHVVADYFMGGVLIKQLMEHVSTESRCGIEVGHKAMQESHLQPGYIWDLTVVGTKRSDQHDLVDKFDFTNIGGHVFVTPLWEWTDDDVNEAADKLGFRLDRRDGPEGDTGNFVACMACVGTEDVYCPKVGHCVRGVHHVENR